MKELYPRAGLNIHAGNATHPAVAASLGMPFVAPERS